MVQIMQLIWQSFLFYNIFLSFLTFVRSEFDERINEVDSPAYYKYDAKPGQFPWLVSFKTVEHCMGTLIHPSWVLSAAHCLDQSSNPVYYTLQLGEQVETAAELHPYPKYGNSKISRVRDHAHDIALLKTENPFKPAPTLPIRSIPYVSDKHHKRPCQIIGFVKELSNPREDHKTLQFARVFGLVYEDCYKQARIGDKLMMRHTLCTTGIDRNANEACSGNPGGPLVCPVKVAVWKKTEEVELVGVSSWNKPGIYCGAMSQYTDVGYFIDWLNATIKGESHHDSSRDLTVKDLSERDESHQFTNAAVRVRPKYIGFFHIMTSFLVFSKYWIYM